MEHFQTFARHLTTGAPLGPNGTASVRVKTAGTDTDATLYSDDGVTPKANPFSASAVGLVSFYAANGRYDVTVTPSAADLAAVPAAAAYTLADVLLDDPADV